MLTGNKRGLIDTLRVHIAPVGFEVDRIVLPALRKKADRVWLITEKHSHQENRGSPYAKSIARKLKESNIECQQASADRIDLFDILRALRTIIIHEKGNHILVNVSVGSKIQAIASMMACMMFKDMATIRPYYVVPEKYNTILLEESNQETEGMKDIISLPDYKIETPNEKLIECMYVISLHKDNKITKRELKDLALNKNLIQVGKKDTQDKEERRDQAAYMALNKNLIEPLMDWKFISVEKIGSRHIVSLTDEGINALRFLHENK
jgi:Family of unknown function (DUF6293)